MGTESSAALGLLALASNEIAARFHTPGGAVGATAIELQAMRSLSAADRRQVESEACSLLTMLEPRTDPAPVRWVDAA